MKTTIRVMLSIIGLLYPAIIDAQNKQGNKSIAFVDYGPVAFDSFWRLPDDRSIDFPQVEFSSRMSTNTQSSTFFTQYFRADIPLGSHHSLTIRMPYHHFHVDSKVGDKLGMTNYSGHELGDIDLIFNIRLLKHLMKSATNDRLFAYLTAEMHTAPTDNKNRQFTDVLKLLGTVNAVYTIHNNPKRNLISVFCFGGGGWNDLVQPSQKHAVKLSAKLNYNIRLGKNKGIAIFAGDTFIYAEGESNKGSYFKTGVNFWKAHGVQVGLNIGLIQYYTQPKHLVHQYEFSAWVPIKWNNQQ